MTAHRITPVRLANLAARRASSCTWIYFIEGAGLVKIGATTQPPRRRLQILALSSPVPLTLLAVIPGQHREQELHDRFRASHSHGEWFTLTPDLKAFIDEAWAAHGELDPHFGVPVADLREALSDLLSEGIAS